MQSRLPLGEFVCREIFANPSDVAPGRGFGPHAKFNAPSTWNPTVKRPCFRAGRAKAIDQCPLGPTWPNDLHQNIGAVLLDFAHKVAIGRYFYYINMGFAWADFTFDGGAFGDKGLCRCGCGWGTM